jgi:hypothetical protein
LKFSEEGWKKKIDAAMSASNQELDFVIEFIERKGKFMDYIDCYLRRFIKHRLASDATTGVYIARIASRDREIFARAFDNAISTNLRDMGPE